MDTFTVSDTEMQQVVAEFLAQGHVDTVMALFRHDHHMFELAGAILDDERYIVRLGMVLLFEELVQAGVKEVARAIPSLAALLEEAPVYVRGEAATILGLIGTEQALARLRPLLHDPEPQLREIAADFLPT
ncbi:MAG TPA: HEAT repeat domain-containing protein [Desulfobacterales bacterium]|nr:HEAT repeat domain-containing protein [Desulfobacterales bacterium]